MTYRAVLVVLAAVLLGFCPGCRNAVGAAEGGDSNPDAKARASSSPVPIPTQKTAFSPPVLKPAAPVDPAFRSCNPYYPLVPGSLAKYSITKFGSVVGTVNVVVNAEAGKGGNVFAEITQRVDPQKTQVETTTRKYICIGETVQVIEALTDNDVGTNAPGTGKAKAQLAGKFPSKAIAMVAPASLTPGSTWSYSMVATITAHGKPPATQPPLPFKFEVKGTEEVTVPAGTFRAVHIETEIETHMGATTMTHHTDEYYAPGIGLVKRGTDQGASWELVEYSGLKPTP
jgi:hypothetical protein